jgi:hypothetical protein
MGHDPDSKSVRDFTSIQLAPDFAFPIFTYVEIASCGTRSRITKQYPGLHIDPARLPSSFSKGKEVRALELRDNRESTMASQSGTVSRGITLFVP